MKIHFHFLGTEVEKLTWDEYEAIEMAQDGNLKLHRVRPLLARFMVDDQLKPLEHAAAMRELGKIPLTQAPEVLKNFMDALKDKAVPKEIGDSSKQG